MKDTPPLNLRALNAWRWLKEYFISWGVLSAIYSVTVTLVLQPFLERALNRELPVAPIWALTCASLLVPGILESLNLGSISVRFKGLALLPPGIFSEPLWNRLGRSLVPLYLRHELRRGSTLLTLLLTVLAAGALPADKQAFWVLIAQLPAQRALYSIHHWRRLARGQFPAHGGPYLLTALACSQAIQWVISWGALGLSGFVDPAHWWRLGPASLGAVLSTSAVALEGDSGRPWMVNLIGMTAGILGGFLCLYSPFCLAGVAYFMIQLRKMAAERILSVESLDEDFVIP